MKRNDSPLTALKPLAEAPTQAYLSDRLQVADVLLWILEQTGPAAVRLSSFSISEEFLRRMFFIRRDGLVTSLQIILDFKATNKTLKLWPFIAQTVEHCYLAANHSKLLLVEGGEHKVAVVMSQNLTRGNRYECGFISSDPAVFDGLSKQFDYITSRQSLPFDDLYRQTVAVN